LVNKRLPQNKIALTFVNPNLPSKLQFLFGAHKHFLGGLHFVCGFLFLFSSWTESHITKCFVYTWGKKTRPYVKTLPMPKCLSPASQKPRLANLGAQMVRSAVWVYLSPCHV
uniref:Uncharacterized protein n=1 Tax=Lynx canadensis TaxID=61383 RepID=A0A667HDR6_LYNCA